jgi:HK97 gp10 family phage protein
MGKSVNLTGDNDLIRALETLGGRVVKKVVRSAVTAGARPILKAAKAKVTKRSGLLGKSLTTKVKTNKNGSVTARIGAATNVVGTVNGKPYRPARIAHLVEKGHIDRAGNFVPPRAFLFPAANEQNDAAVNAISDKLAAGIAKEAAKGGGR